MGTTLMITGTVVAAAALHSGDTLLTSDGVDGTTVEYLPRHGEFSDGDAIAITVGAGMVAVGDAIMAPSTTGATIPQAAASTPMSVPKAMGQAQQPVSPTRPAGATRTSVTDPAVIEAACQAVIEG